MNTIVLTVSRYRPEIEDAPTFQDYEVPLRKDWVVLDALNYVKDRLDGTLSFRWSCRMGICGSCGMMVNGIPRLTCETFLTEFAPGPVRIEPLSFFPVVRDLVVDISDFMGKLEAIRPWIIRKGGEAPPEREYRQKPEEIDLYHFYSLCINCMLCYSACPIYGLEPRFTGPAAIALSRRYDLDGRDEGERSRLDVIAGPDGVWQCTFVGECSEVCPKGVDPARAIQEYKVTCAAEAFLSLFGARRKR